jgi:hypothetical protein
MTKQTTRKPSNVVALPTPKKPSNNPNVFHIEGDVMPSGSKNHKDRVSFSADLDFTGVEQQDVFRMAAQTIVIKLAGNCRTKFSADTNKDKAGKVLKAFPVIVRETIPATINVKEVIVSKLRANVVSNRVEKMAANIEKLSPEKQREMLERLTNMLKPKK